jgi:hypothetical protein
VAGTLHFRHQLAQCLFRCGFFAPQMAGCLRPGLPTGSQTVQGLLATLADFQVSLQVALFSCSQTAVEQLAQMVGIGTRS